MEAAVNGGQFRPLGFRDINFSATRPAGGSDVRPQHPKTGPHTDACRHGGAPFNASIGCCVMTLRLHAGGCEAESAHRFLPRYDAQQAIMDISIVCATGVILQFLVAPTGIGASVALLERPLVCVYGSAIELVAPDDVPLVGWWRRAAGLVQREVIEI